MRPRLLELFATLVLIATAIGITDPASAKTCGYDAYVKQMRSLIPDYDQTILDGDMMAISPQAWLDASAVFDEVAANLHASRPPADLAEWVDAVADQTQLYANMTRDIGRNGIMSVLLYGDSIDAAQARIDKAESDLLTTCSDFKVTFAKGIATPTASPVATPYVIR